MQEPLLIISSVVSTMIRLSVNILTSSIILLQRIEMYSSASLSELIYSKIASISTEDIFSFALKCGWVYVNNDQPYLTLRGVDILRSNKHDLLMDAKRQMLEDYILKIAPIWTSRIPYGRQEAAIFMTKDEKACFAEANLFSEYLDASIVNWWDRMADHVRARSQQIRNNVGRMGERNTLKYERIRTSYEPKWMSIESNLLGYDITSRKGKDHPDTLLIEVKASSAALNEAVFYVTAYEWQVAQNSSAYVFHLWCLSGRKKLLAVITPSDIVHYIPTNNLEGTWEKAKIPYSCFEKKFVEVVL